MKKHTNMKKTLGLVLTAALGLGLVACGSSSSSAPASASTASSTTAEASTTPASDATDSANTDSASDSSATADFTTVTPGKLTMSTNAAFPPYESTDDAGNFVGIDVDIAQTIADKLGLELQIDDMGFDAALTAAQNGKSDIVMSGVTVNEERLKIMEFSTPYTTAIQAIIVPEDSDITDASGLEGKRIGTQVATTGNIYCVDDFGDENVVSYDDAATAIMALKNGQVDCVVIDDGPAKEFVKVNPGLKVLEAGYAVEDYGIGTAKGNTALIEQINAILEEMKADGTLDAIIAKHIN